MLVSFADMTDIVERGRQYEHDLEINSMPAAVLVRELVNRIEELEAENERMVEQLSIARLRHRRGDMDGVWEALTGD